VPSSFGPKVEDCKKKQKEQQTKENKDSSLVNQGNPLKILRLCSSRLRSLPLSQRRSKRGNLLSVNMSPLPVPNSKEDASGLVPHQTTQAFSGTI
jgi:hypothetical protein